MSGKSGLNIIKEAKLFGVIWATIITILSLPILILMQIMIAYHPLTGNLFFSRFILISWLIFLILWWVSRVIKIIKCIRIKKIISKNDTESGG